MAPEESSSARAERVISQRLGDGELGGGPMTESEFLQLVCSVRKIQDPAFLDLPFEESPFDSLDLLALRSALEVRLGRSLTDEKFLPKSTLKDLFVLVNR